MGRGGAGHCRGGGGGAVSEEGVVAENRVECIEIWVEKYDWLSGRAKWSRGKLGQGMVK